MKYTRFLGIIITFTWHFTSSLEWTVRTAPRSLPTRCLSAVQHLLTTSTQYAHSSHTPHGFIQRECLGIPPVFCHLMHIAALEGICTNLPSNTYFSNIFWYGNASNTRGGQVSQYDVTVNHHHTYSLCVCNCNTFISPTFQTFSGMEMPPTLGVGKCRNMW